MTRQQLKQQIRQVLRENSSALPAETAALVRPLASESEVLAALDELTSESKGSLEEMSLMGLKGAIQLRWDKE